MDTFVWYILTLVVVKMKKTNSFKENIKRIEDILFNSAFAERARLTISSFTRNRVLPVAFLCAMLIRGIKTSTQLEIDDFFKIYNSGIEEPVTKQAVSKARTNLNPEAIKYIFTDIRNNMCKVKDLEYWGRYRLCAMDGSDIALYNSLELKELYGTLGGSEKAVGAMLSLAYDPLNNIILDGSLNHSNTDERITAKEHIEVVEKLPLKFRMKNLYIMDRGYPSRDFIAWLLNGKHKFLMRVKKKFNLEFDSVFKDEKVSFVWNNRTYRVRILKIKLDSGEIETLITNLDEKDLPYEKAKELYFMRWGIETKFNSLKNKLELENMSGRRVITVQQDVWASMLIANLLASLEWQTNEIISEKTTNSNNKYQQTTNENRLISKARDVFYEIILETSDYKKEFLFERLIREIVRHPTEVKPERSSKRKTPRKAKFHDTYKSVT